MRHANRKATKEEIAHLKMIVTDAFPEYVAEIGGHSQFGGHRAPRVRTIAMRVKNAQGKYISNVIWLDSENILSLDCNDLISLVDRSNN